MILAARKISSTDLETVFNWITLTIDECSHWTLIDDDADDYYSSYVFYSKGRSGNEDIFLKIDHITDQNVLRFWTLDRWNIGINIGHNVIGGISFSQEEIEASWIFVNPERIVFIQKKKSNSSYNAAYVGGLMPIGIKSDSYHPSVVINMGADSSWMPNGQGKVIKSPTDTYEAQIDKTVSLVKGNYEKLAKPGDWSDRYSAGHIGVEEDRMALGILSGIIYSENVSNEDSLTSGPFKWIFFPLNGSATDSAHFGVQFSEIKNV